MLEKETISTITRLALEKNLEPSALLAVCDIESGGRVFARVEGRNEPLIRFEGHYFDRRLSGFRREAARKAGLASPRAGKITNPRTQPARWRMLKRAMEIDRKAALESVSWGLGQVMGSHWSWLGYATVNDLVAEARSGAEGQVRLMLRFIEKAGLTDEIRRCDWHGFARGYNGPAYRKYGYHLKLDRAFRKYRKLANNPGKPGSPIRGDKKLCFGNRGSAVVELQRMLTASGFPVAADGVFGRKTRDAVTGFQKVSKLTPDGIAGPATMSALMAFRPSIPLINRIFALMKDWFRSIFR